MGDVPCDRSRIIRWDGRETWNRSRGESFCKEAFIEHLWEESPVSLLWGRSPKRKSFRTGEFELSDVLVTSSLILRDQQVMAAGP